MVIYLTPRPVICGVAMLHSNRLRRTEMTRKLTEVRIDLRLGDTASSAPSA
jgi:hypothetical protein